MKITIQTTSALGYNVDFEFEAKTLTEAKEKEVMIKQAGYTPRKGYAKYTPKPQEFVPNLKCPDCGKRIVKAKTTAGKEFYKCEDNTFKDPKCKYFKYLEPKAPNSVQG